MSVKIYRKTITILIITVACVIFFIKFPPSFLGSNSDKELPIESREIANDPVKLNEKLDFSLDSGNDNVASKNVETVELLKPSITSELRKQPFFVVKNTLLERIGRGDVTANYLLGNLIYECIGAPKTSEEERKLIEHYYEEVDSLPEFELAVNFAKDKCFGYQDDEDRKIMISILVDGAARGDLYSSLLLYDIPPTQEIYDNPVLLERFLKRKYDAVSNAFSKGSIDAGLKLVSHHAMGDDENDAISMFAYSKVVSMHYDNEYLEKQSQNFFDNLKFWQQDEAMKEVQRLEKILTANEKISKIVDEKGDL